MNNKQFYTNWIVFCILWNYKLVINGERFITGRTLTSENSIRTLITGGVWGAVVFVGARLCKMKIPGIFWFTYVRLQENCCSINPISTLVSGSTSKTPQLPSKVLTIFSSSTLMLAHRYLQRTFLIAFEPFLNPLKNSDTERELLSELLGPLKTPLDAKKDSCNLR